MNIKFMMLFEVAVILASCNTKNEINEEYPTFNPTPAAYEYTKEELIKEGAYLVVVGACHDCHSPKIMTPDGPEPDPTRLLSGHPKDDKIPAVPTSKDWILFSQDLTAFVGPWGVSYSANLTPHATGTEGWTLEQFKTALRKGKYKGMEGSRNLLPPMPWQMYRNFDDHDMLAIFTYLQSLPPIDNLVPAPVQPDQLSQLTVKK